MPLPVLIVWLFLASSLKFILVFDLLLKVGAIKAGFGLTVYLPKLDLDLDFLSVSLAVSPRGFINTLGILYFMTSSFGLY